MPGSSEEPTATQLPGEAARRGRASSSATARLELVPGTLLGGRFRIVALLGAGGMGEVYRADDLRLGQPVALKFLPRRAERTSGDRLAAEARVGREVAHPNVCRLYDLVEVEGRAFIVMEYVDGEDLASLLRRIGHLPAGKATAVARDLCAGLSAIHDRGLVHRDLKPGNVMVDGSGRARITDFGLALRSQETDGVIAGTPSYMAPEQLEGGTASVASDIYALGLILYETFTGTRVFTGTSVAELREQHRLRPRLALAETVPGLDPGVERAIFQCLEADASARPSSARAVLAALPGQDPLEAALAAGETPSPEMVAAAAERGDLPAGRAWALLAAVVGGACAIVALHGATMLYRRAPLALSPAALARKAAEIREAVGAPGEATDTAFWLEQNPAYPARSRQAILFSFRSSPVPMVAKLQGGENRIALDDPPFTTPGMARITLDGRGRLRTLVRLPIERAESPEPTDPGVLLAFAGLESRALRPAEPRFIAPTDNDRKQAFAAADPEGGSPLEVQVAWLRGRPVFFNVTHAGAETSPGVPDLRAAEGGGANPSSMWARVALTANIAFLIVIPIGTWLLAVRNVRRRRVDRRGTLRLVAVFFLLSGVSRVLRADHARTLVEEWQLLAYMVAESAFWSLNVGVIYVAVEPFVRRRWPNALISWTRLLAGQVGDPMVGRDVLAGFVAGLSVLLAWHLTVLAPPWFGGPPPLPLPIPLTTLAEARHLGYYVLRDLGEAIFRAFGLLALLVLLRGVLRSQLAALIVAFVPLAASFLGDVTAELPFRIAYAAAAAAIAITVLLRYGVLSLLACAFLILTLRRLPLTLDAEAFYFGRSAAVLVLLLALTLWAFRSARSGKPLFGRPLFED